MTAGVDLDHDGRHELAERFVGVRAGHAEIVAAKAEVRSDDDEPYLMLSLSMGPPPASGEWTTDDLFELWQEVRRRIGESGVRGVRPSYVGGASGEEGVEDPHASKGGGQPVHDPR